MASAASSGWSSRIAALVVVGCLSACSVPRATGYLRVARLELDGDLAAQASVPGVGASAVATTEALGLDEEETAFQPRFDFDWDPFLLSVEGYDASFSGDGVADATLDFGSGGSITAGVPVRSELDLGLYFARAVWDVVPDPLLDLGIGFGVGLLEYDFTAQELGSGASASNDDDLPFAFLSVRAARQLGRFELAGMLSGLDVSFSGDELMFYDLDLSVGYRLVDAGSVEAVLLLGFRQMVVDYETEDGADVDADIELSGPYLGLSIGV